MDYTAIGQRMKEKRTALACTQERFAEKIGITPGSYRRIEAGTKGASVETLVKIAKHLNATVDYLLFGTSPYEIMPGKSTKAQNYAIMESFSPLEDKIVSDLLQLMLQYWEELPISLFPHTQETKK